MVPTFFGRIQTRIATLLVIGSLWLLLITPVLPQRAALSEKYQASFLVLGLVMGLGLAWEFIYHGLQQFRWEKDWPAFFGLITGVPEAIIVWLVLRGMLPTGLAKPNAGSFISAFATVWLLVWMWLNGPMRVPLIRWRFHGGRIL